ncbi:hypothetical protein IZU89_08590 [Cellulophaga lytica]|uniref:hypothetical protein n=1 Tax=Cellulophaga lytica TaxID=979 RepID=UPI0032E3A33C
MKDIKEFVNRKQTANKISKIYGGRIRNTGALTECEPTGNVTYEDSWNDVDDDGKFSDGDIMRVVDPCA